MVDRSYPETEAAESMPGVIELAGIIHDAADGGTSEEYCSWTMANRAAEAMAKRLATVPRGPAQTPADTIDKDERDRIIETCATVAEGFDAACDSPRMKLFVEAGVVLAVYKRDGEIGAAIRALKTLSDTSTLRVSEPSYCALCDLEHPLHEDARGFHHVIKGETVPCPAQSSPQGNKP